MGRRVKPGGDEEMGMSNNVAPGNGAPLPRRQALGYLQA